MAQDILIGFLTSIPIWTILLFFLNRNIKNRDKFEENITEDMEDLKTVLARLDKAIALMRKDLERDLDLTRMVTNLSEKVDAMGRECHEKA